MKTRHTLVKYHGGNRATFECPNGHRRKLALVRKGKRNPGEAGLQVLASWWTKSGVAMECPTCYPDSTRSRKRID